MVSLLPRYINRRMWRTFFMLIIFSITVSYFYALRCQKIYASTLYLDFSSRSDTKQLLNLQWCKANPFLKGHDQRLAIDLEIKWQIWNQNRLSHTFNFLKKYLESPTAAVEQFVRIIYPSAELLPCPANKKLKRYGTTRDSGKVLCGLETLLPNDSCIVYSLGSNNAFDFEESVLFHTDCTVYTFDCTSSPPENTNNRLHFYKICLGENSPLQNSIYPNSGRYMFDRSSFEENDENVPQFEPPKTYMTFDAILKAQNHTTIHVLKMDIEGGEYSVFVDLLKTTSKANLPYQISFESHWWNQDIYHAMLHMSLFSQLWTSGYRLLWYEFNENDRVCIEWTFIRMFC